MSLFGFSTLSTAAKRGAARGRAQLPHDRVLISLL